MILRTARSNHSRLHCVYQMYMNRCVFLLPLLLLAATASVRAQQGAEEETKKALAGRVEEYYKLMIAKKYRQAEDFVAKDAKDDYYNTKKPDIRTCNILKVELQPGGLTATVTIKAGVRVLMMGAGSQVFEMPGLTYWKLDDGNWFWYVPDEVKRVTPFGRLNTNSVEPPAKPLQ